MSNLAKTQQWCSWTRH